MGSDGSSGRDEGDGGDEDDSLVATWFCVAVVIVGVVDTLASCFLRQSTHADISPQGFRECRHHNIQILGSRGSLFSPVSLCLLFNQIDLP